MTSSHVSVRLLADALMDGAEQAGAASPRVRGADWRQGTVTAVGSSGLVTVDNVIPARRIATYLSPAVGDRIIITQASSGNWLALGRTSPATTAGTWQPLPLASGWSAWGSPYWAPAYRINGDSTVSLCGLARAPASTTGDATVGTLPTAARPTGKARFPTQVNSTTFGIIDVETTGVVHINNYGSATASWASLDVVRFRLA